MPLVIIACGASKRASPVPAWDLYTGGYYRKTLAWARTVAPAADIRILSAKYGLVPLHRTLEPYEQTLGQAGSVTAGDLYRQARDQGLLDVQDVRMAAGTRYVRLAKAVWPHAVCIFDSMPGPRGMGYQMRYLTQLTRRQA